MPLDLPGRDFDTYKATPSPREFTRAAAHDTQLGVALCRDSATVLGEDCDDPSWT